MIAESELVQKFMALSMSLEEAESAALFLCHGYDTPRPKNEDIELGQDAIRNKFKPKARFSKLRVEALRLMCTDLSAEQLSSPEAINSWLVRVEKGKHGPSTYASIAALYPGFCFSVDLGSKTLQRELSYDPNDYEQLCVCLEYFFQHHFAIPPMQYEIEIAALMLSGMYYGETQRVQTILREKFPKRCSRMDWQTIRDTGQRIETYIFGALNIDVPHAKTQAQNSQVELCYLLQVAAEEGFRRLPAARNGMTNMAAEKWPAGYHAEKPRKASSGDDSEIPPETTLRLLALELLETLIPPPPSRTRNRAQETVAPRAPIVLEAARAARVNTNSH